MSVADGLEILSIVFSRVAVWIAVSSLEVSARFGNKAVEFAGGSIGLNLFIPEPIVEFGKPPAELCQILGRKL